MTSQYSKGVIRQRHSSYIGIYACIINTLSIQKKKKNPSHRAILEEQGAELLAEGEER